MYFLNVKSLCSLGGSLWIYLSPLFHCEAANIHSLWWHVLCDNWRSGIHPETRGAAYLVGSVIAERSARISPGIFVCVIALVLFSFLFSFQLGEGNTMLMRICSLLWCQLCWVFTLLGSRWLCFLHFWLCYMASSLNWFNSIVKLPASIFKYWNLWSTFSLRISHDLDSMWSLHEFVINWTRQTLIVKCAMREA